MDRLSGWMEKEGKKARLHRFYSGFCDRHAKTMGFTRVWPVSMPNTLFFLVFEEILKISIKILLKILINCPWGPLQNFPGTPGAPFRISPGIPRTLGIKGMRALRRSGKKKHASLY